jgi:hypothetical protein
MMKHISLITLLVLSVAISSCNQSRRSEIIEKCDLISPQNIVKAEIGTKNALVVLKYYPNEFIKSDSILIAPVAYVINPEDSDFIRIICSNVKETKAMSGMLLITKEIDIDLTKRKLYLPKDSLNFVTMKTVFCDVQFQNK